MNLNVALSFSDVQSTIKYLRDRNVVVYDVKCSDQFCNLRLCVKRSEGEDLKNEAVCDKWIKYFQESYKADCHSELLKTAEFFIYIPCLNASVERIFSS
jgi:hypothetical protein